MERDRTPVDDCAVEILRWPTERSREWVCRLLESVPEDPNIVVVIAVGSAVRPNVPSSDLDLVVICNDPSVFKETPPLEVDLRAYAASGINAQVENGHDMLGWAIKFGRVLYQRNRFWDTIIESWCHRLPLPSARLARERASAAYHRLARVLEFNDADAAHEQAVSYLTHLARAELLDRGIYPASRPELATQLRAAGNRHLADQLDRVLENGASVTDFIRTLLKQPAATRGSRQNG